MITSGNKAIIRANLFYEEAAIVNIGSAVNNYTIHFKPGVLSVNIAGNTGPWYNNFMQYENNVNYVWYFQDGETGVPFGVSREVGNFRTIKVGHMPDRFFDNCNAWPDNFLNLDIDLQEQSNYTFNNCSRIRVFNINTTCAFNMLSVSELNYPMIRSVELFNVKNTVLNIFDEAGQENVFFCLSINNCPNINLNQQNFQTSFINLFIQSSSFTNVSPTSYIRLGPKTNFFVYRNTYGTINILGSPSFFGQDEFKIMCRKVNSISAISIKSSNLNLYGPGERNEFNYLQLNFTNGNFINFFMNFAQDYSFSPPILETSYWSMPILTNCFSSCRNLQFVQNIFGRASFSFDVEGNNQGIYCSRNSLVSLFHNCTNLTTIYGNFFALTLNSNRTFVFKGDRFYNTDLSYMFYNCCNLSNFLDCRNFVILGNNDLNITKMFDNVSALNFNLEISSRAAVAQTSVSHSGVYSLFVNLYGGSPSNSSFQNFAVNCPNLAFVNVFLNTSNHRCNFTNSFSNCKNLKEVYLNCFRNNCNYSNFFNGASNANFKIFSEGQYTNNIMVIKNVVGSFFEKSFNSCQFDNVFVNNIVNSHMISCFFNCRINNINVTFNDSNCSTSSLFANSIIKNNIVINLTNGWSAEGMFENSTINQINFTLNSYTGDQDSIFKNTKYLNDSVSITEHGFYLSSINIVLRSSSSYINFKNLFQDSDCEFSLIDFRQNFCGTASGTGGLRIGNSLSGLPMAQRPASNIHFSNSFRNMKKTYSTSGELGTGNINNTPMLVNFFFTYAQNCFTDCLCFPFVDGRCVLTT